MKKLILNLWNTRDIPSGVRVLTETTGIRWFGWGLAEPLIPVMIFSLSAGFAQAGLIKASYEIALILCLPVFGLMADRMKGSTLVLIGLFVYFFVGISYLLVGVTGLVIFIVAARFLNGIAFALDSVGRETYFRRHALPGKIATVFGYFDTVANLWWIAAALSGMFLIKYFDIPTLLFFITPTAMISFFVVWNWRRNNNEVVKPVNSKSHYGALMEKWSDWSFSLKSLIALNFFISFAGAIVIFFLPIEIFLEGASLQLVLLFGIVAALPTLFGFSLGKLFDIKGMKILKYSLALLAALILSLAFPAGYLWKILVMFVISIILELLSVGNNELITVHANPEHFGRITGIMRSISNLGALTGPLVFGIMLDSYGVKVSYITLAILVVLLTLSFHLLEKNGIIRK